jgi:hypothetical protein
MNTLLVRGGLAACVVLASGCTTVLPVIPKLVPCEIAAAQLQETCAAPGTIGPDVTYSDVIGVVITDRKNLRLCAEKNRFLVESINACNAAIAEHNKKLEAINSQIAGSR